MNKQEKQKMTFAEIAEQWRIRKFPLIKPSTASTYSVTLERDLIPYFGKAKRVTEDEAQKFLLYLVNDRNLSPHSTIDVIRLFKQIMKFWHKRYGHPSISDWELVMPKQKEEIQKKKPKTFTIEQERKLMDHIVNNLNADGFKYFGIYIALSAGLRIGEVCGLKWEDMVIGDDRSYIVVNRTIERICTFDKNESTPHTRVNIGSPKTKTSHREVPMNSELRRIVSIVKSDTITHKPHYFVLTGTEKPTEPRTLRNQYRRLLAKLGLPQLVFHSCRHTFATRCIESGVTDKTTSQLLGHSNIATTLDMYVHPSYEDKEKGVERMFESLAI